MKAVVTYNGKSFDIPLLNTRYTMMGMTSPFEEIDHFDLLPLARRLWRLRLESRTLGSVETNILGVKRGEKEVPGYMIPEMYFDFLKTGDARPMSGIFYHNAIDILSLAGLFSHAAYLLNEPFSKEFDHPEDLVALARFFEDQGDIPQAETLYQRTLDTALEADLHWDTLTRLSFLHKKREDWAPAINLWEQAAENKHLYAFEELAKYYEHRAKDLPEAQKWTLMALKVLESQKLTSYIFNDWYARLEHRLDRLKRRIGRTEKG
jgi:tetratricopeptide (TPR) repeat protein